MRAIKWVAGCHTCLLLPFVTLAMVIVFQYIS